MSALADLLLELCELKTLDISENNMDDHTFEVLKISIYSYTHSVMVFHTFIDLFVFF